jgi:hypothetical protein
LNQVRSWAVLATRSRRGAPRLGKNSKGAITVRFGTKLLGSIRPPPAFLLAPRLQSRSFVSLNLSFALSPAEAKTSYSENEDEHRFDAELHPSLRGALLRSH